MTGLAIQYDQVNKREKQKMELLNMVSVISSNGELIYCSMTTAIYHRLPFHHTYKKNWTETRE
jgi:hypothetical protein